MIFMILCLVINFNIFKLSIFMIKCLVINLNIIMLSILVYLSIYDFMFSNEFKYFYA